jgi:hypothetical protein
VGQAARARHAVRAGVGPGNDLLEDRVGVPPRGDEGYVREHVELPHNAGLTDRVPPGLGDQLLGEQRGAVRPARRQGRGIQVEFEQLSRAMVFAAGLQQFGGEHRGALGHRGPGVGDEPRVPVRNDRAGQQFQVGVLRQSEPLQLGGEVRVHLVDLRRRLGCDVRHGTGADRDRHVQPVTLEHAARRRDDVHARQPGQVLVPVQSLLDEQRRLPVQMREHRTVAAAGKRHVQDAVLARRTAGHLLRFVLIGRQLGSVQQAHRAGSRTGSTSKSTLRMIRATTSAIPSPVRQFVNTNGLCLRANLESVSITSRLAWT